MDQAHFSFGNVDKSYVNKSTSQELYNIQSQMNSSSIVQMQRDNQALKEK